MYSIFHLAAVTCRIDAINARLLTLVGSNCACRTQPHTSFLCEGHVWCHPEGQDDKVRFERSLVCQNMIHLPRAVLKKGFNPNVWNELNAVSGQFFNYLFPCLLLQSSHRQFIAVEECYVQIIPSQCF